jgi:hypothetical protein
VAVERRCGRGETGRRSRLQLECPAGNGRSRTAQSRGKLTGLASSQSRAKPLPSRRVEGVETGRAAPKAERQGRRDSPDHERPCGGGESRSGAKICYPSGCAGSSPAVRTKSEPVPDGHDRLAWVRLPCRDDGAPASRYSSGMNIRSNGRICSSERGVSLACNAGDTKRRTAPSSRSPYSSL